MVSISSGQKIQLDGHKLMYHVDEVSKWLAGKEVAPIYVEIGPISLCNHKCSFCAFDYLKNHGAALDKTVLINTLKDMAEFGVKAVMFCGEGEPLLYAPLPEVIDKAKSFGIDVAITSNGVLFTPDKCRSILPNLSWIKFSVDAGTPENYAKVHGTRKEDFGKLLENIKFAGEYKKKNKIQCEIGAQMVVTDESISEAENLVKLVKDTGIDYVVFKPYVRHPQSINKKVLTQADYDKMLSGISKKYSTDSFQVIFRGVSFQEVEKDALDYNECYGINFIALIDASGNVLPCSVFYEKEDFYYGNIYKQSFKEIWTGAKRKEVTEKVYCRGSKGCRNNCRLNFINEYLYTLKNKSKKHINFI